MLKAFSLTRFIPARIAAVFALALETTSCSPPQNETETPDPAAQGGRGGTTASPPRGSAPLGVGGAWSGTGGVSSGEGGRPTSSGGAAGNVPPGLGGNPAPRVDGGNTTPRPADAATPALPPSAGLPSLKRGINLGNAMDAPKEGAWGIKLSAEHFKMAKQAGFDHVRLPVRFSAHTEATAPYKLTEALLLRVDWAVNQALGLGLSIVIDIHHWAEIYEEPEANRAKFIEIWKQVATRLKGRPPEVVFELLNEPRKNLTAALWNEFSAEAVKAIRTISPTRDIMIEGVDFASAKELRDTLKVPENDPHIIGSFHHYAPILFTHQGTDSIGPEYGTKGIVYPGPPAVPVVPVKEAMGVKWISDWIEKYNSTPADMNPCSPTVITQELERAKTWARKTGLRVYMGEFGANEFVDKASRIRWLRFIREEAEKRGIGWGLWNMFSGFAIGDAKAGGGFDPDLKAALMP